MFIHVHTTRRSAVSNGFRCRQALLCARGTLSVGTLRAARTDTNMTTLSLKELEEITKTWKSGGDKRM